MPNYPSSLDVLANPGPTTEMDDTGFELDVVIGRIHDILEALEAKLGTGASTAVTQSILNGIGSGSASWLTSPTVSGAFTATAGFNGGGASGATGGQIKTTGDISTTTGINVGSATGAATGEVKTSAAVKAGTGVYPSNQSSMYAAVTAAQLTVIAAGTTTIGTNARSGTVRVVDHTQGVVAIFSVNGGFNTTALLAGNSTNFGVTLANDNRINCIYNGGNYLLYNGYAASHVLSAWFEGL